MRQSQDGSPGHQRGGQRQETRGPRPLLLRYPILMPLLLLIGSTVLGIASFSSDRMFSVLMLMEISANLLYLLIALVLGIAGILAGIISVLEYIDRRLCPTVVFSRAKEHSYANRN